MAESHSISLRASPKGNAEKESLSFLISRINEQRGSFRDLTEESLEAEIRATDEGQLDLVEEEATEDAQDVKSRPEQLAEAREEMLAQIQQASWECSNGLSMISLVLAGHNQRAGRSSNSHQLSTRQAALSTIDPYIKERLPTDALCVDILDPSGRSDADKAKDQLDKQKDQSVGFGWKQQSIEAVADRLSEAATRLEKELQAETRYWDQMLKIKDRGWPVCRLPREKHALGVRYGFAEAHADFRDRGMAALRRDEDGNITLDRGLRFSGDRKLRVQVLQNGRVISCNRLSGAMVGDAEEAIEEDSIEDEIRQARDSLFDEELQAELHREARHLINQGVTCIGDVIQMPFGLDKSIQIDLVDSDDPVPIDLEEDDMIPNGISIALHILLSHAHRQNLRRRSRPPPPLTESQTPRPVYQLLKPIIEQLRHKTNIQACRDIVTGLTRTMQAAGLVLRLEETTTTPLNIPKDLKTFMNAEAPATETLIRSMVAPLHSYFTLQPPSSHTSHKIEIFTNLFPPNFGTTYRSTVEPSVPDKGTATLPPTMQFTSISDLQNHIMHVVTADLVEHIATESAGWTIVDSHTGMLSRDIETSDGKLKSMSIRVLPQPKMLTLQWAQRSEDNEDVGRGVKQWHDTTDDSMRAANERSLWDTISHLAVAQR